MSEQQEQTGCSLMYGDVCIGHFANDEEAAEAAEKYIADLLQDLQDEP